MDKVLAFSILSASPADIAAGAGAGLGGRWPRLSWRRHADGQAEHAKASKQRDKADDGSRSSQRKEQRAREGSHAPRFAPEFDGINCFETIVSH